MENNTKKGLIAAGIIALLVWFSKKGKVTETPTEDPNSGGGGGGMMPLPSPSLIIVPPTPTSKPSTMVNVGANIQGAVAKINPATGLPYGVSGGVSNTGYNSSTNTTTTPTKKPNVVVGAPIKVVNTTTSAPKPVLSSGGLGGFGAVSSSPYTTTYKTVTCNNGKKYNVSQADITAAGGVNQWCAKNGHSVANNPTANVPFDGGNIRPLRKVDFF